MRLFACCFLFAASLAAQNQILQRHQIRAAGTLTGVTGEAPATIGMRFLRAQAPDVAGVYLARQYRTEHNGVTHLIYRQQFQNIDVHNAEYVINLDREGRVLNAGGNLFASPAAPAMLTLQSARTAVRTAVSAVNPKLGERFQPFEAESKDRQVRFSAGATGSEIDGRAVWYAVNGRLEPAWLFAVTDEDGITAYSTVVGAENQVLLSKEPLTWFQEAPRGLVFTGHNPQPNPTPGIRLTEPPAYVERNLQPLTGDPIASPRGWVSGNRTQGNNVVSGINPLGVAFDVNIRTASSPTRDFQFPLELGPTAANPARFWEAAATNLFFWVNRIHDFFYALGFDEQAGNFQVDNLGKGGVGGDPMYAHAQFGSAQSTGIAATNNAFFSTRVSGQDGIPVMIGMYLGSSPGRWADGAYSSETIFHEYTHGVTNRLVRQISGFQGGAMNEAFSDFWALEYLTPEGAPPDGIYPYGEYLYNTFGVGIRSRPYSTNMEVNPLTYRDLGRATSFVSIHNDGGIWMMSLWEMRANLIRQFGEREGRRRLRQNVLDGMKLAPPAPSMVDMRDAILLADRVNFRGESQSQIWAAFAKRGLGVLAYSPGAGTLVVKASYETPSNTGTIGFHQESYTMGDTLRVILYDANRESPSAEVQVLANSGDMERVVLRRTGSIYVGSINTTDLIAASSGDNVLAVIAGDVVAAYYDDPSAEGGGGTQVKASVELQRPYFGIGFTNPGPLRFDNEVRVGGFGPGGTAFVVVLPFEFPFYERKVRQMTVASDGRISFDVALEPDCYDATGLRRFLGVAPMWTWMATNGVAQPNEGVYLSSGGAAFTVRWAGETSPIQNFPFGAAPAPLNFAVTLHEDGRIVMQYGDGNAAVTNPPVFFGCNAGTPVVGISRGNDCYTQVYFPGRVDFRGAPTLELNPPFQATSFPTVRLESPSDGEVVEDLLRVRGIAYDEGRGFTGAVYVLIDGVYRIRTTAGLSRVDACQPPLPGCPTIGFDVTADVRNLRLAEGTHTLQLRVVNARGSWTDYPEQPLSFEVRAGSAAVPTGRIESIREGQEVSGVVPVTGYVYGTAGVRVQTVDVIIDGVAYGRAGYNVARQDVCAGPASGSVNCPGVGFNFTLNTATGSPTLTNGAHSLQVRATDASGRTTLIPEIPISFVVANPQNVPPKGVLTTPTNMERVSGVIRLSGYAWDPDGRVVGAQLLLNGALRANARYGLPRPEACAELPDVTACPNIGFEVDLDTRALPNGLYTFGIRLVDDRGAAVVIPAVTATGINVVVNN